MAFIDPAGRRLKARRLAVLVAPARPERSKCNGQWAQLDGKSRNYLGIALGRSSLSAASMRNRRSGVSRAINDLDPTDLGPTLKHVSNVT